MDIPDVSGLDAVVAGNVRALRARKRWRQADLAEALGWSRSVVAALEAGERRVTLADAAALCSAFDVGLPVLCLGIPTEVEDVFRGGPVGTPEPSRTARAAALAPGDAPE